MVVKLHWYPTTMALICTLSIGFLLGGLYAGTVANERELAIWSITLMSWMLIYFLYLGWETGKRV